MNNLLDEFCEVKECVYKNERYSVRDNGAVMRHPNEGKRKRKDDGIWTFGKPNNKTGYMYICGERVHRIVAFAFLGNPPTEQHVVDHIDTNRRNNRPENLRWLTRLENVLNNPITKARIERICGSIEAFLADPSILRGHEKVDCNFKWMKTVSAEEARISYENLIKWAKNNHQPPKGDGLGEWLFHERRFNADFASERKMSDFVIPDKQQKTIETNSFNNSQEEIDQHETIQSLTPNAVQVDWKTPSYFPCCPHEPTGNSLYTYKSNLIADAVFCKNQNHSSLVVDSALIGEGKSLWVLTRSSEDNANKPWAVSEITFENSTFAHRNVGAFFDENGARKKFTLAQGKEWTGGDVIDDFC